MPAGPPYTANDELTCSSDGYPPPTYLWTVDGNPGSSASTQAFQEGKHVYVCTATVTISDTKTCSNDATVTVTAFSKYQNKCNNVAITLMLNGVLLLPILIIFVTHLEQT